MTQRDPEFFKLHYRQWRRRMHKARVPYDLQGALLAIVIETHLMGGPPAHDAFVLAGVLMTSPRKAMAAVDKLVALRLVRIEDGLVVDKTALEDAAERAALREIRAQAGREGGVRSGVVRRDKARLTQGSGDFASPKSLENHNTNEANRSKCSNKSRVEKSIGGGGGSARACAREAVPSPEDDDAPFGPPQQTHQQTHQDPEVIALVALRDRVIDAAGIDWSKSRNPARWFGSESLDTIRQWQALDLTDDEIVATVHDVMLGKRDGPPQTLSYFDEAMRRRAGRKQAPPLTPIAGGRNHDGQSPREHRALQQLQADLAFADDLDRRRGGG